MGIVLRQSVKTTMVVFGGASLGAIINFLYIYALTKPELGVYTNIIYQGALIQFLTLMGTGHLMATYILKYSSNDERRKALVGFSLLVTLLANIIFTTCYFLLKNYILSKYQMQDRDYLNKFYFLLPLLSIIWSMASVFEFYLYSQSKTAITTFAKEILLRIVNIAIIGAFFYKLLSFNDFMLFSVLAYLLITICLIYFAMRIKGFGISFNYKLFTRAEYKELIRFSWYHLLLGVSIHILGTVDILMLGALDKTGLESVAIYRNAIFVISIMLIPYKAITLSSFPALNQTYIDNDIVKLDSLYRRSAVNILIVAVAMFLLIAINLDNFVDFIGLLKNGYSNVKPIILILMIGQLVNMGTGLNNEILSLSNYYRYSFYTTIILVVLTVLFNRLFIPQYGVYGAAWSSTIALTIFSTVKTIVLKKKLHMSPFSKKTLLVLIAGAIAGVVSYAIPYCINLYIDAIVRSIILLIIYTSTLLLLRASDDLNTYITTIKKTRRLY